MRHAGLDEAQAGINTARRNVNNLRYADDTTLKTESKKLKILLMKVKKESEKVGLKLNIQKKKTTTTQHSENYGIWSHHFIWQIEGETVTHFILGGSKITADGDCSHEIKRCLLPGRKVMINLDRILKANTLLCQHRSI